VCAAGCLGAPDVVTLLAQQPAAPDAVANGLGCALRARWVVQEPAPLPPAASVGGEAAFAKGLAFDKLAAATEPQLHRIAGFSAPAACEAGLLPPLIQ
jgi:hypothetical protein